MTVRAPLRAAICALSLGCAAGRAPVPSADAAAGEAHAAAGSVPTTAGSAAAAAVSDSGQPAAAEPVDFDLEVRPILEANCRPCHFEGGKMYERLPFDRAETVRTLGEALFTRIRDERDQAVIRGFLARAGSESALPASP